jgi:hypothetical protein
MKKSSTRHLIAMFFFYIKTVQTFQKILLKVTHRRRRISSEYGSAGRIPGIVITVNLSGGNSGQVLRLGGGPLGQVCCWRASLYIGFSLYLWAPELAVVPEFGLSDYLIPYRSSPFKKKNWRVTKKDFKKFSPLQTET